MLRLFCANVLSELLCGGSAWKMTSTVIQLLHAFVNTCLRYVMRVRSSDTVSKKELGGRAGQLSVDKLMGRRRWQWIGHTIRRNDIAITGYSMQGNHSLGRVGCQMSI